MVRLSKQELINLAERLMNNDFSSDAEMDRLADEFEANIPYPYAAELIFVSRHEFKDAAELVDFALAEEEIKKLSREELIAVTRKLMTADISSEVESQRLSRLFAANVPHPAKGDLIFYPKIEFNTPEELVDYALAYKPEKE
jgi:hypothetical protein